MYVKGADCMKITISIDDEILKKLDVSRKKKGNLGRSTYIQMALTTQMDYDIAMESLPDLMNALRSEKRGGVSSDINDDGPRDG